MARYGHELNNVKLRWKRCRLGWLLEALALAPVVSTLRDRIWTPLSLHTPLCGLTPWILRLGGADFIIVILFIYYFKMEIEASAISTFNDVNPLETLWLALAGNWEAGLCGSRCVREGSQFWLPIRMTQTAFLMPRPSPAIKPEPLLEALIARTELPGGL